MPSADRPMHVVVMGVSATGKTTIAVRLAEELHAEFIEGDDLHPRQNIEKMEHGIPLDDEDRWPWLQAIAEAVAVKDFEGTSTIAACSALRRSYRDFLIEKAGEPILFIYLHGSKELIASRIAQRKHHFMPPSLLDSQFATLEIPGKDENVITVGIEAPVEETADRVVAQLQAVMPPKTRS